MSGCRRAPVWVNCWIKDLRQLSLTRLFTVSDKLLKHQSALETFLADQEQSLFDLNRSIVLYDLTNTVLKASVPKTPTPNFGRSKETCPEPSRRERCDCPLVTLGLVLDGDGFPLGSQVFPGNASEPATLALMLDAESRAKSSSRSSATGHYHGCRHCQR